MSGLRGQTRSSTDSSYSEAPIKALVDIKAPRIAASPREMIHRRFLVSCCRKLASPFGPPLRPHISVGKATSNPRVSRARGDVRSARKRPAGAAYLASGTLLGEGLKIRSTEIVTVGRCLVLLNSLNSLSKLIGTVATISAYSVIVWPRLNSRPRHGLLLIAGGLFHFSEPEIYSRPSPELASGPLESAECKGRRRFRSRTRVKLRPPRAKMFFGGTLAEWRSLTAFCSEKSMCIRPSSCPSELTHLNRHSRDLVHFPFS